MDRVHIVTGAAGDIALATMVGLPEGVILACDRDLARLDERVGRVRSAGRTVHVTGCDITDRLDCDRLYQKAMALGRPATLINLAGMAPPHDPALIHAVNLMGTINLLEVCEESGATDFVAVCVASLAGHRRRAWAFDPLLLSPPTDLQARAETEAPDVSPSRLAYALSKRGVLVQVRARAAAWGAKGNRILSISPGVVADSAMGAARKAVATHGARAALPREAGINDIADAITFSVSPKASFMSGTDILVDGGFLALVDHDLSAEDRDNWHAILT
nr:SDR family oxidoreductase [Sphingomonas sp. CDS-1]